MKTYFLLLPALSLFCSCYIRHTEPREPYTLYGNVSDCSTGKAVAGVTISLIASSKPSMGFFGTTEGDAGTAVTDEDGNYAIVPIAYSFTAVFYVKVNTEHYQQNQVSVYKSDISATNGSTYELDSLCINQ